MKKQPCAAILAAFAFLGLAAAMTEARPPVPMYHPAPGHRLLFDEKKFMRVSELRPGMKGYALTVFRGTKIEKFHIEILGVVSKFNNGKDYILFRALDGPPVTRKLNIAHGMSGSPIYINGRLVGAISMGIPGTQFAKEPIALATPIEEMFDAWNPDLPSKVSSISASPDNTNTELSTNTAGKPATFNAPAGNFEQLGLPLSVSGVSSHGIAMLNARLAPYHFTAAAGGGGGMTAAEISNNPLAKNATLEPGSAVGISLVQGDVDVTATGTVTYRDGNRLLLFGHPLAGLGPIDAPMTTAFVVSIFPSYQDSIKLGAPIKTVGRIFQDRPFSVGGIIGPMPHMIPMTVSVNDLSIKRQKTFHARVINHPLLTAQFVSLVADQAIEQIHGEPGDSMAKVTMDVDVDEIGHIHRTNTFYDAQSIDQSAIADLDGLLRLLSSNPFYPLEVKSIKMSVTINDKHDTAELDRIFIKQSKFAPGDTVDVGVVLKPFKREPVIHIVKVKIPATAPNGTLSLSVKGGGNDSGGSISIGGLVLMRPSESLAPAANVTQLVKDFATLPRNNELVVRLVLPTTAINISGEKLPNLPPTIASVMQSTRSTGLKTEHDEVKVIQPTAYIITGSQNLTITVQKKNVPEGQPPPTPDTPAPSTPPSPSSSSLSTPFDEGDDMAMAALSTTEPADAPNLDAAYLASTPKIAENPSPAATPQKKPASGTPAEATPATAATPTAKAPPVPPIKTVGRLASVWRQGTTADFIAGTLENVSVTNRGELHLSPPLTKFADTSETYMWSIIPDGHGNIYAGTGDRGIIYKIGPDGKPKEFYKTGELEVQSLALDDAGNLYAGTAPHGIVFKISPTGKGAKLFKASEKYVTALLYDTSKKRLLAATGGGTGAVYGISSKGVSTQILTLPQGHVLSLAEDKTGNVYAGTSPNGIVFKIDTSNKSAVFYDAVENDIPGLAVDSSGNVYAGTAPKGNIYKIAPDGHAHLLYDRATGSILSLKIDDGDKLDACSGNSIFRISPDETAEIFVAPDDEQFLTTAPERDGSAIYAGTSTVGSVYKVGGQSSQGLTGHFLSSIHDAGNQAHWGTLSWTANEPEGTHVEMRTRSGDVAQPDASWSEWSPAYTSSSGQTITSPPGRFLQYQATLVSDAGAILKGSYPELKNVAVYYLPRNQVPSVKITSPQSGDALSKTATLQWTASDPDKDVLTYDVAYSSDGGKTWQPLKKSASPAAAPPAAVPATAPGKPISTPPAAPKPGSDEDIKQRVDKMRAEMDKHPEMPQAVRDQILAQAPSVIRRTLALTQTGPTTATGVKDTTFSWDTTAVPDGQYRIQVTASDKTSNPQDALTATAKSDTFIVANKPPVITAGKAEIAADKSVTIHGSISTGLVFVKAVQYKVDDGDPSGAAADDGIFDSTHEDFTVVTGPLTSGAHTILIEGIDRAGNSGSAKVEVKVP